MAAGGSAGLRALGGQCRAPARHHVGRGGALAHGAAVRHRWPPGSGPVHPAQEAAQGLERVDAVLRDLSPLVPAGDLPPARARPVAPAGAQPRGLQGLPRHLRGHGAGLGNAGLLQGQAAAQDDLQLHARPLEHHRRAPADAQGTRGQLLGHRGPPGRLLHDPHARAVRAAQALVRGRIRGGLEPGAGWSHRSRHHRRGTGARLAGEQRGRAVLPGHRLQLDGAPARAVRQSLPDQALGGGVPRHGEAAHWPGVLLAADGAALAGGLLPVQEDVLPPSPM